MKKLFLLALSGLLLLSLAGCAPAPAGEDTLTADVAGRLASSGGEADVRSLEIIKRQTDKGAKTDLVYVQVDYATPTAERSERYKPTYGLYNEGWILDGMEPYEQQAWAIKPLAGPEEETVAAALPEGAELLDSRFDEETGTQTVQYRVFEEHTYCDIERTEQLTLTMDAVTEQWQAGERSLLEQDQDWTRLLGLWELAGDDDNSYEIVVAILPFAQAQLDGYVGYEVMGANGKWYSTADIAEDDTSAVRLPELLEPVEGEALPTFRSTLGDDSLFRLDPDDGPVYMWQGKPDQEAAMELYQPGGLAGTAGDVTWSVDTDWTLTISGSGLLPPSESYWSEPDPAWKEYETYFRQCSALAVQPGITAIGDRAFWYSRFSSVELPEGLEHIGQRAFYGSERLTDVHLSEGLLEIWPEAFAETGLTSVVIPDSVTYIGDRAFAGCEHLEHVRLPEGVQLGEDVFEGCTALQDLPEPVPTPGPTATPAPVPTPEPTPIPVELAATEDAGQEYIDKIVFLGDSTTYGLGSYGIIPYTQVWTDSIGTLALFNWAVDPIAYYDPADPKNAESLSVVDCAARRQPEYLVITLGINGIAFLDEADFKSYYTDMINSILAVSPNTRIICQSIYPVIDARTPNGIDNEGVNAANGWIRDVAEATGTRYLNTHDLLTDESGNLIAGYNNGDDMGIHLNADGFAVVLQNIRTHAWQ